MDPPLIGVYPIPVAVVQLVLVIWVKQLIIGVYCTPIVLYGFYFVATCIVIVILTLNNITEDALTVTWFNHDTISHTVTSDEGYSDLLGNKLDSGLVESGKSYAFVFTEEGPYQYHCRIHPWMKGSISIMPSNFT